jgi:1-acyl-sn-glycerol-3-phosphate acyltransferase
MKAATGFLTSAADVVAVYAWTVPAKRETIPWVCASATGNAISYLKQDVSDVHDYASIMDPKWWASRAKGGEPGRPSDWMVTIIRRWVTPFIRLMHRPVLEGSEHLPEGPFLLVANHSAIGVVEVFSLVVLWLERFKLERRLSGMAHPFGFSLWPVSTFLRNIGAIPSTYIDAEAALAGGCSVLVFPGGDYESTRPFWQADEVQFKGRKGFLRIARNAGVPIVPLGIRGSIYSAPILWRSELLAWVTIFPRVIGVKRFPLTLLGVIGAGLMLWLLPPIIGWLWTALATWAWLSSPFMLLPWLPTKVVMRIGPPLANAELFADDDLDGAYDRVVGAVQSLVAPPASRK